MPRRLIYPFDELIGANCCFANKCACAAGFVVDAAGALRSGAKPVRLKDYIVVLDECHARQRVSKRE
jgi:hypothetical protein